MSHLRTEALAHQRAAVQKLSALKVGALFAEMGTGKTRIFYELALSKVLDGKASRVVVLCPVSGMRHLRDEAHKHTFATVAMHHGSYNQAAAQINIIGIESMSSSITAINKMEELCRGAVVVVDESHLIKNQRAKRTKRITDIARHLSRYRYISTGTPMSNGVEDLWSQCWFLSHHVLGYNSYPEFRNYHLRHEGDYYGRIGAGRITKRLNTDVLAEKIAPYAYETRKADCLDLPKKTYAFRTASMNDAQRQIYEETKIAILNGTRAFEADDATIYRLFTSLQMIASGLVPRFVADLLNMPEIRLESPKIPVLLDILDGISKGAKTVVWCKYIAEADFATEAMRRNGYTVHRMDGRLNTQQRHEQLEAFHQTGQILVATTATGGQVLDIGFADYAIYLSNSFDYQQRAQSEDRLHRIGMSSKAHYIDIYAECPIENRIKNSLARKENAVRNFADKVRQLRSERRLHEITEMLQKL